MTNTPKEPKKIDLLVVGELNIDLIMDDIPGEPTVGKEQIANTMTLTLGSSSAIFAANISSLGTRTAFSGLLGEDQFGSFVRHSLEKKNVDARYVETRRDVQTGVTVAFNYGQERMMVTYPGAMAEMTIDEVPLDHLEQFRHLHLSNIFLQPGLKPQIFDLFSKAREAGLTTSMDPQWDPEETWDLDFDRLLTLLDFFLPNEHELLSITGSTDVRQALDRFSDTGCTIVVKMGEQGSWMQTRGKMIKEPAYSIPDFADAIGAGDSFNAGLIHAFLNGKPLRDCLKLGNLAGAVSTTRAGGTAGIKSYKQIMETGKKLGL